MVGWGGRSRKGYLFTSIFRFHWFMYIFSHINSFRMKLSHICSFSSSSMILKIKELQYVKLCLRGICGQQKLMTGLSGLAGRVLAF